MASSLPRTVRSLRFLFSAALKTEPQSVPAHYLQGLNYYRNKMFPEAVDELQKTVQLSPDYSLAVFNLGMAQAHAGQFNAAIASLQRALQLDSTNYEAAYNLGVAYIQKKQLQEAAEAFRRSITINPDLARSHRALGETLMYSDKLDEAIVELRRAVELAHRKQIAASLRFHHEKCDCREFATLDRCF